MKNSRDTKFSNLVTTGKDFIAMLRDGILLLLVILLVAWPKSINNILVEAGFEEGSFAGIKWKAKLKESDDVLLEAQSTIVDLREQNNKLSQTLSDAKENINSKKVKNEIENLEGLNKSISKASEMVQEQLEKSTSSNALLIHEVQNKSGLLSTWGVVYGADSTLDKAEHEIKVTARKMGLHTAAIYYRNNYYRSVATTSDRLIADNLLNIAKQHRKDSYIVNMSSWCGSSVERNGYFECAPL